MKSVPPGALPTFAALGTDIGHRIGELFMLLTAVSEKSLEGKMFTALQDLEGGITETTKETALQRGGMNQLVGESASEVLVEFTDGGGGGAHQSDATDALKKTVDEVHAGLPG